MSEIGGINSYIVTQVKVHVVSSCYVLVVNVTCMCISHALNSFQNNSLIAFFLKIYYKEDIIHNMWVEVVCIQNIFQRYAVCRVQ